MKQVSQSMKDGRIEVLDVPVPALRPQGALVRTAWSLISAGTEGAKVDLGQKSLLAKARSRPDQVKQVMDKVRSEGVLRTYRTVKARLEEQSPIGYSSAGVVDAARRAGCGAHGRRSRRLRWRRVREPRGVRLCPGDAVRARARRRRPGRGRVRDRRRRRLAGRAPKRRHGRRPCRRHRPRAGRPDHRAAPARGGLRGRRRRPRRRPLRGRRGLRRRRRDVGDRVGRRQGTAGGDRRRRLRRRHHHRRHQERRAHRACRPDRPRPRHRGRGGRRGHAACRAPPSTRRSSRSSSRAPTGPGATTRCTRRWPSTIRSATCAGPSSATWPSSCGSSARAAWT